MGPDAELVAGIRTALAAAGDPERAADQQRYMKSEMPYRGISSSELTALLRPLLSAWDPGDRAAWEATVRALWDGATHREEWYAALAVARHRRARPWLDAGSLELSRHLVVTGAWWDVVDVVAVHLVGVALRADVLCQVGARDQVDADLLRPVVEANLDDGSFWLRKAIGWALRDRARTDPAWVRAEVDRLGDRLPALSRREATKHL